MSNTVVSARYASALFSIGKDAGMEELERYGEALRSLGEAVRKTPRLDEAFRNPVLSAEEKKKLEARIAEIG